MSELTTIARPYAKAAFDYAVEQVTVDNWQQMLTFAAAVARDETMRQFLNSAVSAEQMAEVFIQVCGQQLDEKGQNLIRIMAENQRLLALPEVLSIFETLKADYERVVDVEVRSAVALSDAQQTALSAQLEKRLSRKVKLNCSVAPELVAGMVIKAGDTVIDGSIRGQLARMTTALQS